MATKPSYEYALSLLTSQFQGRTNNEKFIKSILEPLSSQDSSVDALKDDRALDTAVGRQLDLLGEQLGLKRLGLDDAAYRQQLEIQLFLNTSTGTRPFIIEAVKRLSDGNTIIYHDLDHAAFSIFTDGEYTFNLFRATISQNNLLLNGGTFVVDGDDFIVKTSDTSIRSIESIFADIIPAGVGFVPITTSLGEPTSNTYGFNDDSFEFADFTTDTGDTLTLNGSTFTIETENSAINAPYFFQGFGEVASSDFVTNTGDTLLLNSDTFQVNDVDNVEGGGIIPEVVVA